MNDTFLISELPAMDPVQLTDVLMLENSEETGNATLLKLFDACVAYYRSSPAFGADVTRAVNAYLDEHGVGEVTLKAAALAAHPVGCLYGSDDPTSPEELFGGVWESLHGCTIYAEDETHPAGSTGGEETHTLTVEELPAHNHALGLGNSETGTTATGSKLLWKYQPAVTSDYSGTDMIKNTGAGQAHNNMMPYYAAYVWRRTA